MKLKGPKAQQKHLNVAISPELLDRVGAAAKLEGKMIRDYVCELLDAASSKVLSGVGKAKPRS
jgi:hypothetical protein